MIDNIIPATVILGPLAVIITAWLGYTAGKAKADPDPILTPSDGDEQASYVWLATVEYSATDSRETLVVEDSYPNLDATDVRQRVSDTIIGATVVDIQKTELYRPTPLMVQADDTDTGTDTDAERD